MASKSSPKAEAAPDPDRGLRRASHRAMAEKLNRRRAELAAQGIEVEVPRNAGKNRTPSKRALLKAIEEAGGKW